MKTVRRRIIVVLGLLLIALILLWFDQKYVDAGCIDRGNVWDWKTLQCL